jgi:hypothetical protein
MKAIQIISQDLFDKVRSRFTNLEMGDETGAVTIDPAEARFFDFDFVNEGVNLGRVSISLGDPGSLKIYYSQGITENQDDPAKNMWYDFLKEMRLFAMRRLMRFDTRDIAKTNLDKNDFQHLAATQGRKEEPEMNTMNESRWNQKSSRKTSRAVKGATEVIVRHHSPVDEMYPGARSQKKNIKAIYIQNRDGERFKYPFIHPAGAFAMAQHVDHGGVPHDPAGKAIVRMSEQIAQLQEFSRQVQHTQLHDDAMGIKERAVGRLQELKAQIESLSKRHHYEAWTASFVEQDEPLMAELDPVTMETYKQQFTETNFKEDLTAFFPLIHSIMQEANTVDLEDFVNEGTCSTCHCDPCECDDDEKEVKESAFDEFTEWAEAVEQGKLTDDQIQSLKQAMDELPNGEIELGVDGQTAWQFFSSFGLEDSDLEAKLRSAADLDPTTDPMEVLQVWAQENYPELLVALGLSGTEAPAAEPAPAPEVPPAQPPVAEGSGANKTHLAMAYLQAVMMAPMGTPEKRRILNWQQRLSNQFDIEIDTVTLARMLPQLDNQLKSGQLDKLQNRMASRGELEIGETRQGVAGGKEGNMVQEVAKIVKSFYNRDNPEVGPFRGGEGIVLDVKKSIGEKFGEKAGEQAAQMAEQFMDKLTQEWQQRHGSAQVDSDDGLARLKELVGNIKAKVEGVAQESGPDKSQIPAYKRKEQGGDWKMSTKDLEKEKTNSPTSSAGLARKKAELGLGQNESAALEAIMRIANYRK